MITGETHDEIGDFPHLDLFNFVVAENGGLLHWPQSGRNQPLGKKVPNDAIRLLRRRGVDVRVGRVILITPRKSQVIVRETLDALKLDCAIAFNRRDLIILPAGLDKASALRTATDSLNLNPQAIVGVGDAENDVALVTTCGLGVAVAKAVDLLKKQAKVVTAGQAGKGVRELIEAVLNDQVCELNGQRS